MIRLLAMQRLQNLFTDSKTDGLEANKLNLNGMKQPAQPVHPLPQPVKPVKPTPTAGKAMLYIIVIIESFVRAGPLPMCISFSNHSYIVLKCCQLELYTQVLE